MNNLQSNNKHDQVKESVKPSVEVQFAQRLAANEPKIRDKAVTKLKVWLTTRASGKSGAAQPFSEEEMLRLWKGLHYCFWMSDKPLIQEELAESISTMIHCFKRDASTGLMFLKSFLVTLGREWNGIDQWRMDKFMLFARRMLRQAFVFVFDQIRRRKSSSDILEDFASVYDRFVFGSNNVSIGFQLHFVDVFLEELAKVNATLDEGFLTDEMVHVLLEPFVDEMVNGTEVRMQEQIEERIFNHLIRQSDVALAYEEGSDDEDMEGMLEDSDGGDDQDKPFELSKSDPRAGVGDVCLPQLDLNYEKIAEVLFKAGSQEGLTKPQRKRLYDLTKRFQLLDGGVYPFALEINEEGDIVDMEEDIEEIDYEESLSKERQEAVNLSEEAERERLEYRKAMAERKRSEKKPDNTGENAAKATTPAKKKKGKEKAQERIEKFQAKKRKEAAKNNLEDVIVSTEVASKKKKRKASVEEDKENNETQEANKVLSPKKGSKKSKAKKAEKVTEESVNNEDSPKKKKTSKKGTHDEPVAMKSKKEIKLMESEDKSSQKKLKRKSDKPSDEEDEKSAFAVATKKAKKQKKMSNSEALSPAKKAKKTSPAFELDNGWDEALKEGETEIVTPNPLYKGKVKLSPAKQVNKEAEPQIQTPTTLPPTAFFRKAVSKSAQKKNPQTQKLKTKDLTMSEPSKKASKLDIKGRKLNFAMSQNKYQSLKEIDRSIQESPDIPFDAERVPSHGVLKVRSATSTPTGKKMSKQQSVMYNTMINGKSKFAVKRRAVASDFF